MTSFPLRLFGCVFAHVARWALLVLLISSSAAGRDAGAKPMSLDELPPELKVWVPWVLHDLGDRVCPVVQGSAVCMWPGVLELELDERGGRFRQRLFADRSGVALLPGSSERWPQEVALDGKPTLVLQVEGRPAVRLPKGDHDLTGRFLWDHLPERLAVHPQAARIELTVNAARVPSPHRGDDGSVWLAAGAATGSQEPERLELEVFRHLADGVPLRLKTRIALRVGGRARELTLTNVLPPEARALAVTGELPVRLEASGLLTVQLRPGQHVLELDAVFPAEVSRLGAPKSNAPWAEPEVWVFVPDNRLRQVDLSGAPAVDPQRTNLPAEWKSLRAFLLEPGQQLELETLRRGEPEPPPNRLSLERSLWLDLDGGGFTVRDAFTGTMQREHRLVLQAGTLGHALAEGQDQLIVRSEQGHSAVELRSSQVDLRAEWHIEERDRTLPAVGWSEDVEQLSTTLHLPPGWELLGASGVDDLSHSWVSEWNLFDVFFVLVVALAVGRLFGLPWGGVALAGLTLSHGQAEAPYAVWAALLILAGGLAVIPASRLRFLVRGAWWVAAVVLVVGYVTFAVSQAQTAFYPATMYEGSSRQESYSQDRAGMATAASQEAVVMAPAPPAGQWESKPLEEQNAAADALNDDVESAKSGGPQRSASLKSYLGRGGNLAGAPAGTKVGKKLALQQDPQAVVQTGPGVPTWQWRSWNLSWSGPVDRAHELSLWLISPWQNTLLSILRILLVGGLLWAVLRRPPGKEPPAALRPLPKFWSRAGRSTAAAAATALLVVLVPATARGEIPAPAVLDELRERMVQPKPCSDPCATVPRLDLRVQERTLEMVAEVHAPAATTYQLPGPAHTLGYTSVQVDGRPNHALIRWADGFFHLRLEAGRHRVVLTAPLDRDEVVLSLGTEPRLVLVSASGWQVDGVQDGRVEGSVSLTRLAAPDAPDGAEPQTSAASELPPWFEVKRRLLLGVTWSMETVVQRVSAPGAPAVVRLPLLAGEQVTESGLNVEKGEVVLSFDRDADVVTFESSLKVQPQLQLVAAKGKPWSEHWTVDCGALWHCSLDGLAPYEHETQAHGYAPGAARWMPSFRPWPGENVTISAVRPEPAPGPSITIDAAELTFEPGTRLTRASLDMRVRNSAGGTQHVELPATARSVALSIDGISQPIKQAGARVAIALTPGTNVVKLTWQQPEGLSASWLAPQVKIAGGAVNAEASVVLPRDRWLLGVGANGASWGPAVLFWPYLVLIVGFGFALSRVPRSPLAAWQWMLLGLGLALAPAPVAVLVASWFFVLAYRDRYTVASPLIYNIVQLALLGWTLVFLGCLIGLVYDGLVVRPDMAVAGRGSTNERLVWYADRIAEVMPAPRVVSAPLWVWRLAMLSWALWLAFSLLRWLRWGFAAFSAGGAFRRLPRPQRSNAPGQGEAAAASSDGPGASAGAADSGERSAAAEGPGAR